MIEMIPSYIDDLIGHELSENTISKYSRDIRFFLYYINGKEQIIKSDLIEYRQFLTDKYKISTVNSYLISINRYLSWLRADSLTVNTVRAQRKTSLDGILSVEEYNRLLEFCLHTGKERDYLLLRTIAGTGIRVGELKSITYEAALRGEAEIYHKCKCRSISISEPLSKLLIEYCTKKDIQGVIFSGRVAGYALSPKGAWKCLKRMAEKAQVDIGKVKPHNLRHLFAKTYMQRIGNMSELADLLGHASIETTRIYAQTSREEKRLSLNKLEL